MSAANISQAKIEQEWFTCAECENPASSQELILACQHGIMCEQLAYCSRYCLEKHNSWIEKLRKGQRVRKPAVQEERRRVILDELSRYILPDVVLLILGYMTRYSLRRNLFYTDMYTGRFVSIDSYGLLLPLSN
jgi:hypothetical protein